ncbi:sulfur carrier protein ThiS [Hymenobacter cavernae]|uniref:Sulfur carrier protein ThiS n=1 Tax=Hymenobacter cavernae TaxID=2044852 RepID=A0ABQ1TQC2_9BACT|nr:sulfur carrier protein ThiS [Hymenobacter cavernae]GGF01234.1 hypothetical protein GCM10011383_10090 [Hymenobacter cavernae]
MVFYVNNKPHEAAVEPTLAAALTELQLADQRGVAVAVNDRVVPRTDWASYALQAQDRITVIRATQGG